MTHMMPWSTTALWEALASPAPVYSSRLQKEELAGTETEQSGPEKGRKPQSQSSTGDDMMQEAQLIHFFALAHDKTQTSRNLLREHKKTGSLKRDNKYQQNGSA